MENTSSAQSEQLLALLAQRVDDQRADLADRYFGILRESIFSNSLGIRPNALRQIATDEVEALLYFLKQSGNSSAKRGEQLHQSGFTAGAVLRLGQVTRQFLLDHSENGQIASILEVVDAYATGVVEGFVQSIDNTNKIERVQLEHVLTALRQRGED